MYYRIYCFVVLLCFALPFGLVAQNNTGTLVKSDSIALKLVSPNPGQGEAIRAVVLDPLSEWIWKGSTWYQISNLNPELAELWTDDGNGDASITGRAKAEYFDGAIKKTKAGYQIINPDGGHYNTLGISSGEIIIKMPAANTQYMSDMLVSIHVFGDFACQLRITNWTTGVWGANNTISLTGSNPTITTVKYKESGGEKYIVINSASNIWSNLGVVIERVNLFRNSSDLGWEKGWEITVGNTELWSTTKTYFLEDILVDSGNSLNLDDQPASYYLNRSNHTGTQDISTIAGQRLAVDVSVDASEFDNIGTTYTDVQSAMQRANDLLGGLFVPNQQIAFGNADNELTTSSNFRYIAANAEIRGSGNSPKVALVNNSGTASTVWLQSKGDNSQVGTVFNNDFHVMRGLNYDISLREEELALRAANLDVFRVVDDGSVFLDQYAAGNLIVDENGKLVTVEAPETITVDITSSTSSTIDIGNKDYIIFSSSTETDFQFTRFGNVEVGSVVTFVNGTNKNIEFVPNESNVTTTEIKFRTLDDDIVRLGSRQSITFKIVEAFANTLEGTLIATTGSMKKGLPVVENNWQDVGPITANQAMIGFDFTLNPDRTGIICQCDDAGDSILGLPDLGDGRTITLHNNGSSNCLLVGNSTGATEAPLGGGDATLGSKRSFKLQQHGEGASAYWSIFN